MCYRQTSHYWVLCDRCGPRGSRGAGWSSPSAADEAALEAGWEMTMTEHLCLACMLAVLPGECARRIAARAVATVLEVAR